NTASNDVTVFRGRGDGAFCGSANYAANGQGPIEVVAADLDGDGKPELLTANYGSWDVSVLLGLGKGEFQSGVAYPVVSGAHSYALAVTELNGDGKPDVVAANSGQSSISALYGNGNGTLRTAVNTPGVTSPAHLVAFDCNGDGKSDIASANNNVGTSANVSVL